MLKKYILAIALMVVGLAVVSAQTRQQQQELEQIARRSMNGVSPQDRQRAMQIMTDVYVAQGMSRQQAGPLAEMAVDSMFTTDVGEMSAEERRMFEKQNQSQQQTTQPQQQQRQPGDTAGWPTAILRDRGLSSLRQPSGTTASYTGTDMHRVTIYLTGANANTLQDLKRQIESALRIQLEGSGNRFYAYVTNNNPNYVWNIRINLEGNQVTIEIFTSAG